MRSQTWVRGGVPHATSDPAPSPGSCFRSGRLLLFAQAQSCVCQRGCSGEGCSCLPETELDIESFLQALPGGLEVECLQYD